MDSITNKAHLIFWISIPAILLIGITNWNGFLDISIHDTYYVIASPHVAFLISILFLLIGLGYWLMVTFNRPLSKWLTLIHMVITIDGSIIMWIASLLYTKPVTNPDNIVYDDSLATLNAIYVIGFMVILIGQLIYLINIGLGLLRK